MATNYQQHYKLQLEAGQEFQDHVAERLCREGIPLINFQSRKFQMTHGENLLGLEIKFDNKFRTTGNFWIEIAEKSDPARSTYVTSGICREDGSWLYGIGDYTEFFLFSKRTLREHMHDPKVTIIENSTKTSRGFLLPRRQAAALAERMFLWDWIADAAPRAREPGEEG